MTDDEHKELARLRASEEEAWRRYNEQELRLAQALAAVALAEQRWDTALEREHVLTEEIARLKRKLSTVAALRAEADSSDEISAEGKAHLDLMAATYPKRNRGVPSWMLSGTLAQLDHALWEQLLDWWESRQLDVELRWWDSQQRWVASILGADPRHYAEFTPEEAVRVMMANS